MKDRDFEVLKTAIEQLQDVVAGNAELTAQAQGRLEQSVAEIERRLDEVDLVHENLIGEIRQLNKNVEDLKDE